MTQRIAQQCLRIGITRPHTPRVQRQCIRKYSSAASPQPTEQQQQPIDPSSSETKPKKSKPRKVLPQDLLPFDPPPRPNRRHVPAIAIRPPSEKDTTVESVYPPGQQGPIPLRIRKPFPVNQSWDTLHRFYSGLFGFEDYIERGYLTKELAWQSITYKSYNHGLDLYNEKLAHLGKRAIRMVTATHVLELPSETNSPQLNNLNVNALSKSLMANVMDYHLVGDMGIRYGVAEVMRWKPAFNDNLERSGIRSVAGECMCAIAGAVTLSKGTVHARAYIVNRYLSLLMQNEGERRVG